MHFHNPLTTIREEKEHGFLFPILYTHVSVSLRVQMGRFAISCEIMAGVMSKNSNFRLIVKGDFYFSFNSNSYFS